MTKKEIQILITIIHIVSKKYPKDKDVKMVCDSLEKILVNMERKK
jgi:hypothetical protein